MLQRQTHFLLVMDIVHDRQVMQMKENGQVHLHENDMMYVTTLGNVDETHQMTLQGRDVLEE